MSFQRDLYTIRALLITHPDMYYHPVLMRAFFDARPERWLRLPAWKNGYEELANMKLMIKTVFMDNYELFLSTVYFHPLSNVIGQMERKSFTTTQCVYALTCLFPPKIK